MANIDDYRNALRKSYNRNNDELASSEADLLSYSQGTQSLPMYKNKAIRTTATVGRQAMNVGKGAMKGVEGVADGLMTVIGWGGSVVDYIAGTHSKKAISKAIKYDATEKIINELNESTNGAVKKYYNSAYGKDTYVSRIMDEVSTSIGQMLPSIVAGVATGGAGFVAQAASLATLGVSAMGTSTEEKLKEGYGFGRSSLYGALQGAKEVGTEIIGGKLFDSKIAGAIGNSALSSGGKATMKTVLKDIVHEALGEGAEEAMGDLFEPLIDKIALNDKSWKDTGKEYLPENLLPNVAHDFLVGAVTGAFMDGATTSFNIARVGKDEYLANLDLMKANEYVEEGKKLTERKQRMEAKGLDTTKVDEKLANIKKGIEHQYDIFLKHKQNLVAKNSEGTKKYIEWHNKANEAMDKAKEAYDKAPKYNSKGEKIPFNTKEFTTEYEAKNPRPEITSKEGKAFLKNLRYNMLFEEAGKAKSSVDDLLNPNKTVADMSNPTAEKIMIDDEELGTVTNDGKTLTIEFTDDDGKSQKISTDNKTAIDGYNEYIKKYGDKEGGNGLDFRTQVFANIMGGMEVVRSINRAMSEFDGFFKQSASETATKLEKTVEEGLQTATSAYNEGKTRMNALYYNEKGNNRVNGVKLNSSNGELAYGKLAGDDSYIIKQKGVWYVGKEENGNIVIDETYQTLQPNVLQNSSLTELEKISETDKSNGIYRLHWNEDIRKLKGNKPQKTTAKKETTSKKVDNTVKKTDNNAKEKEVLSPAKEARIKELREGLDVLNKGTAEFKKKGSVYYQYLEAFLDDRYAQELYGFKPQKVWSVGNQVVIDFKNTTFRMYRTSRGNVLLTLYSTPVGDNYGAKFGDERILVIDFVTGKDYVEKSLIPILKEETIYEKSKDFKQIKQDGDRRGIEFVRFRSRALQKVKRFRMANDGRYASYLSKEWNASKHTIQRLQEGIRNREEEGNGEGAGSGQTNREQSKLTDSFGLIELFEDESVREILNPIMDEHENYKIPLMLMPTQLLDEEIIAVEHGTFINYWIFNDINNVAERIKRPFGSIDPITKLIDLNLYKLIDSKDSQIKRKKYLTTTHELLHSVFMFARDKEGVKTNADLYNKLKEDGKLFERVGGKESKRILLHPIEIMHRLAETLITEYKNGNRVYIAFLESGINSGVDLDYYKRKYKQDFIRDVKNGNVEILMKNKILEEVFNQTFNGKLFLPDTEWQSRMMTELWLWGRENYHTDNFLYFGHREIPEKMIEKSQAYNELRNVADSEKFGDSIELTSMQSFDNSKLVSGVEIKKASGKYEIINREVESFNKKIENQLNNTKLSAEEKVEYVRLVSKMLYKLNLFLTPNTRNVYLKKANSIEAQKRDLMNYKTFIKNYNGTVGLFNDLLELKGSILLGLSPELVSLFDSDDYTNHNLETEKEIGKIKAVQKELSITPEEKKMVNKKKEDFLASKNFTDYNEAMKDFKSIEPELSEEDKTLNSFQRILELNAYIDLFLNDVNQVDTATTIKAYEGKEKKVIRKIGELKANLDSLNAHLIYYKKTEGKLVRQRVGNEVIVGVKDGKSRYEMRYKITPEGKVSTRASDAPIVESKIKHNQLRSIMVNSETRESILMSVDESELSGEAKQKMLDRFNDGKALVSDIKFMLEHKAMKAMPSEANINQAILYYASKYNKDAIWVRDTSEEFNKEMKNFKPYEKPQRTEAEKAKSHNESNQRSRLKAKISNALVEAEKQNATEDVKKLKEALDKVATATNIEKLSNDVSGLIVKYYKKPAKKSTNKTTSNGTTSKGTTSKVSSATVEKAINNAVEKATKKATKVISKELNDTNKQLEKAKVTQTEYWSQVYSDKVMNARFKSNLEKSLGVKIDADSFKEICEALTNGDVDTVAKLLFKKYYAPELAKISDTDFDIMNQEEMTPDTLALLSEYEALQEIYNKQAKEALEKSYSKLKASLKKMYDDKVVELEKQAKEIKELNKTIKTLEDRGREMGKVIRLASMFKEYARREHFDLSINTGYIAEELIPIAKSLSKIKARNFDIAEPTDVFKRVDEVFKLLKDNERVRKYFEELKEIRNEGRESNAPEFKSLMEYIELFNKEIGKYDPTKEKAKLTNDQVHYLKLIMEYVNTAIKNYDADFKANETSKAIDKVIEGVASLKESSRDEMGIIRYNLAKASDSYSDFYTRLLAIQKEGKGFYTDFIYKGLVEASDKTLKIKRSMAGIYYEYLEKNYGTETKHLQSDKRRLKLISNDSKSKPVFLTDGEAVQIYMTGLDTQQGIQHLISGEFTYEKPMLDKDGKPVLDSENKIKKQSVTETFKGEGVHLEGSNQEVKITEADYKLIKEYVEKKYEKYIRHLKRLWWSKSKEIYGSTIKDMLGYSFELRDNYFHIETDKSIQKNRNSGDQDYLKRVVMNYFNPSFNKDARKNANGRIEVSGILKHTDQFVNSISNYAGMAPTIKHFNRIFDTKYMVDKDGKILNYQEMKAHEAKIKMLKKQAKENGTEFIDDSNLKEETLATHITKNVDSRFMEEYRNTILAMQNLLNINHSKANEMVNSLASNIAATSILANAKVAMSQVGSYWLALRYMNIKDLSAGLVGNGKELSRIIKRSAYFMERSYSQASLRAQIIYGGKTTYGKSKIQKFLNWSQFTDAWVMRRLLNSKLKEYSRKNKIDYKELVEKEITNVNTWLSEADIKSITESAKNVTEDFLKDKKMTREQFESQLKAKMAETNRNTIYDKLLFETEMIARRTQPQYDALENGSITRTGNLFINMLLRFTAYGRKAYSNTVSAFMTKFKGNGEGSLAGAITGLAISSLVTAIIQTAFKHGFGKDDDDEKYIKEDDQWYVKMLKEISVGTIENMTINNLAGLRNIYDAFVHGNEPNDLLNSEIKNLFNALNGIQKLGSNDPEVIIRECYKLLTSIASMSGMPLKNLVELLVYPEAEFASHVSPNSKVTQDLTWFRNALAGKRTPNKDYKKLISDTYNSGHPSASVNNLNTLYSKNGLDKASKPVALETSRLYASGYYNVLPTLSISEVSINGEQVKLSSKQQKNFNEIYSQAHSHVEKVIATQYYLQLSDEEKAKLIKKIYRAYYNIAKYNVVSNEVELTSFEKCVQVMGAEKTIKYMNTIDKNIKRYDSSKKKSVVSSCVKKMGLSSNNQSLILELYGY